MPLFLTERRQSGNQVGEPIQLVTTVLTSRFPSSLPSAATPLSGNFNGSSANNQGSNGNFWSSTRNNGNNMYNLNVDSSSVNPENNNNRNNGNSVRCVAQ